MVERQNSVTASQLLARLRAGEAGAWKDFLSRYERLIYSVPRRYGLDPDAAADVFQDVLLAFLRGLPRLRDPQALPRWLTQTAYRLSRTRMRMERRERAGSDEFWASIADSGPSVLDELERLEAAARVRVAMESLPTRCRLLLEALFFQARDASYADLAQRMAVPIGSLGPTRQRCLERLLRLLQDSDHDSTSHSRIERRMPRPAGIRMNTSSTSSSKDSRSPTRTRNTK